MTGFAEAIALYQAGKAKEAELLCRRSVAGQPDHAACLHLLAVIQLEAGRLPAALSSVDLSLASIANDAGSHNTRGNILKAMGRHAEAIESYTVALRLAPAQGDFRLNRAAAFIEDGNAAFALEEVARASKDGANPVDAKYVACLALKACGQSAQALEELKSLTALVPNHGPAWQTLGAILLDLGRDAGAAEAFARVLMLQPDNLEAGLGLAILDGRSGHLDRSMARYADLIARYPGNSSLLANRGITRLVAGMPELAFAELEQAVRTDPAQPMAARALLAASLYIHDIAPDRRFYLHTAYGNRFGSTETSRAPLLEPNPERQIRLGFVSADFRSHPVSRNLTPLLQSLNRQSFHLSAYADLNEPDASTAWLKDQFDRWSDITGLSDRDAARVIARDRIDILLILGGHFDRNRPLIAAHHAAPVQISFHDPSTSGLSSMDYLIADPILCPANLPERFTERIIRLPYFYSHSAIDDAPEPRQPLGRGPIVFGSFNNPAKITQETLRLWNEVLTALPGSRLVLKYRNQYRDAATRNRITASMQTHADRIDFRTESIERESHLALYHDIDIALDPLPFSGSTTSFEALWMGVPVVTLAGDVMVSRWTASILSRIGLSDLIAVNPADYLEKVLSLANDPDRRLLLRHELRPRLSASALCDGPRYAGYFGRLMRTVWRKACKTPVQTTPS